MNIRRSRLWIGLTILIVSSSLCRVGAALITAWQPPETAGDIVSEVRTTGDNPPTDYLSLVGPYGVTFSLLGAGDGYYYDSYQIFEVPQGAAIVQALVMTGVWIRPWESEHTIDFYFDGTPYGAIPAVTLDENDTGNPGDSLSLGGFVIDVTKQVSGNGYYTPTFVRNQEGSGPFASLLWVVYQREDLPWKEIHLNFGGESLRFSSSTGIFSVLGSGSGTLHVFTQADQYVSSQGTESVEFNGQQIACCQIFAGEVDYGSYLQYAVTVHPGVNNVTITTGEDWFGWHVGALVVPVAPVSVSARSWSRIKALYR